MGVLPPPRQERQVSYRARDGVRLSIDLRDKLQAETWLTGHWDRQMSRVLAESLPRGGTFFDVGSNVGLASVTVAALCRDKGITAHAFEPAADNVAALRRNIAGNPALDIRVVDAAVSAVDGTSTLVFGAERGHHYLATDPGGGESSATVRTVTLDSYAEAHGIDTVDAMKIDVEGRELDVLEGADRLLAEGRIGLIVCEVEESHLRRVGRSKRELVGALVERGFSPSPLLPLSKRVRQVLRPAHVPLGGDVVFARMRG
jgi:FkbM family methyltransferase